MRPEKSGSPPVAAGSETHRSLILRDLAGKEVDPFATTNVSLHAFIFLSTECPISNRYAPEIRRLFESFGPQGCAFWVVYPNRDESDAEVKAHCSSYQLTLPALRDPRHDLVNKTAVRVTPEAALFSKTGELLYRGRIDDRYVALGKSRPEATQQDLAVAMESALRGEKIKISRTTAIGCSISNLP